MSSGDELRVEPGDLTAKAGALTTETSDTSAAPTAPSAFTFVQSATAQVVAGANTLKSFVASGNAEADRLAAVLNAAASTYKTVDDRARYALEHFPPLPVPNDPVPVTPALPPVVPAVEQPPFMDAMAGGDTDGYMDAKTAAQIIHSGNPGPMRTYAGDAREFATALRDQSNAFSLAGVHWEGTAAEAAGNALRQHQEWLNDIAEQYEYLATQAEDLAAAQEKWADQHPTVEEIEQVEREMQAAVQNNDRVGLRVAQDKYGALFAKSEEVRVSYSADVTGKGLLGVPKPPSGAAPVAPVSGNGDPRKARSAHRGCSRRPTAARFRRRRPSRTGSPARGSAFTDVVAGLGGSATRRRAAVRWGPAVGWRPAVGWGPAVGWSAGRSAWRRPRRRSADGRPEIADGPERAAGGGRWRVGFRRRRRRRYAVVTVVGGGDGGDRCAGADGRRGTGTIDGGGCQFRRDGGRHGRHGADARGGHGWSAAGEEAQPCRRAGRGVVHRRAAVDRGRDR